MDPREVMGIGQAVGGTGCVILEGVGIFDNVAVATAGRRKSAVAREQVKEVWSRCAELLHEFIWDLQGYDTLLGGESGGQKQRLTIG